MAKPEEKHKDTKAQNEKYIIALYRIAREGQSTGHVLGLGRTPKQWDKPRIIELAECINAAPSAPYVPVYIGHDPNNQVDRKEIGRTLSAFSAFIHGAQETFAIVIINDPWVAAKVNNGRFNIASIEADLTLEADGNDWKVTEVENVTGIVLGSDETHTPGFKSAHLISAVHEMDDKPDLEEIAEGSRAIGPGFPANIDGGGVHWDRYNGTDLVNCPALQVSIFRRLCAIVRIAKHSNPFPQCTDCPVRST